jgi:hypothetical protein
LQLVQKLSDKIEKELVLPHPNLPTNHFKESPLQILFLLLVPPGNCFAEGCVGFLEGCVPHTSSSCLEELQDSAAFGKASACIIPRYECLFGGLCEPHSFSTKFPELESSLSQKVP